MSAIRLDTVLSLVAAHLPAVLGGGSEALRQVMGLARSLEAYPEGLLEIRLGSDESERPIDLSVAVTRSSLGVHPWLRVRLDALPAAVDRVWYEYDVDPALSGRQPATFIPLRDGRDLMWAEQNWSLGSCGPVLRKTIERLPPGAGPAFLGRMPPHREWPWRVTLGPLTAKPAEAWLRDAGWGGSYTQATEILSLADSHTHDSLLALDLGSGWGDAIGVECFDGHEDLMTTLVSRGLCTGEQADALRGWPTTLIPGGIDEPWPAHLIRASLLESHDSLCIIQLALNHIKVSSAASGGLEAKAYLGWKAGYAKPRPASLD